MIGEIANALTVICAIAGAASFLAGAALWVVAWAASKGPSVKPED